MFDQIFRDNATIQKHLKAPLLHERLMYLQYCAKNGAPHSTLCRKAHCLLIIINFLNLGIKGKVSIKEIQRAADKWGNQSTCCEYRRLAFSNRSMMTFKKVSVEWLSMLDRLKYSKEKVDSFSKFIFQYVNYMRQEKGFTEETIRKRTSILKDFFNHIIEKHSLHKLDILDIDKILETKQRVNGYCRETLRTYASTIRVFLTYAEEKKWCKKGLATGVKTARVYKYETLPQGPSWEDVKKLLQETDGDNNKNIRDRAMIMLCAIYGLRSSEVVKLRIEDLDWRNEIFHIQRGKNAKIQEFPLTLTVGNTILTYLKKSRPHCLCRELFVTFMAPHRPLKPTSLSIIVSRRLKALNLDLKHYGSHSLRHACATHLINEGISLKEISTLLGHQHLDSTRIYAKVDLINLRKVAEFEISDLI